MKRAVIALVAIMACALAAFAGQITPNGAIFAIGVTAADAVVTKQSAVVSYDHQLVIPKFPEGTALIGTIKVVTNSTGQFVPNTTALDDASCTITITNMHSLPLSLNVKAR